MFGAHASDLLGSLRSGVGHAHRLRNEASRIRADLAPIPPFGRNRLADAHLNAETRREDYAPQHAKKGLMGVRS